ncbi:uncharacterized protein IL334_006944 [Kwoniella shivajii]|uniref:Inhibitor I9 domain-containing protein n=1 Tax=Kwoniella shivajii TaxID=564305 RepID=A0ABZ1D7D0_9TREE|nr:hypothetical protein IL334_006944 [Kwoniella shivajii]
MQTSSFLSLLLLFITTVSAYQTTINMANKDVIVQFKKTSSAEERQKTVEELKSKGATIVKDDNLNSKIFPFVTVSLPESDFSTLQSDFSGDHAVVENIEADQEVSIQ